MWKSQGKVVITREKHHEIIISKNDFEYLMENSRLLKEKEIAYNQLFYQFRLLEAKIDEEKVEPDTPYCELCDKNYSNKSSFNLHIKSKKHMKNVHNKQVKVDPESDDESSDNEPEPEVKAPCICMVHCKECEKYPDECHAHMQYK